MNVKEWIRTRYEQSSEEYFKNNTTIYLTDSRANITSLEGMPEIVGNSFQVSHQPNLKDLSFAPKTILGNFYFHNNIGLKSYKGLPSDIGSAAYNGAEVKIEPIDPTLIDYVWVSRCNLANQIIEQLADRNNFELWNLVRGMSESEKDFIIALPEESIENISDIFFF